MPAQILRGFLLAIALYPFYTVLVSWSYWKRFASISGLYLLIGFWAAAAAPGTSEGLVYMRPEITLNIHLQVQPKIVGQGLAFGAGLAAWMANTPIEVADGILVR